MHSTFEGLTFVTSRFWTSMQSGRKGITENTEHDGNSDRLTKKHFNYTRFMADASENPQKGTDVLKIPEWKSLQLNVLALINNMILMNSYRF